MSKSANKIAIIEVDYHPEVLRNMLLILNETSIHCMVSTLTEIWERTGLNSKNMNLGHL